MKKILVVGRAGYIGSHMVLALQEAGYSVVVFDNLSRGFADAVVGAPLMVGDLRSAAALDACFTAHRFDLVMHFAALAYVGESVGEPERITIDEAHPQRPVNPYGRTKLMIEQALVEGLRLQRGGEPSATRLQVSGADFPTTNGSCIRDYIPVTDLCSAHLRAAEVLAWQPRYRQLETMIETAWAWLNR